MSKAPEFRPLAKEELPEAPWIGKLLEPLNRFLSGVRSSLANGLTIADNLNAEVRTIEFTTRADGAGAGPLHVWATRALGQSVATSAAATILFDTEHVDTHGAYDAAIGTFTAPLAGVYAISASVSFAGLTPGTGEMWVAIRKNADLVLRGTRHAIGNAAQIECASGAVALAAGDTITVAALQSNGASRSTDTTALPSLTIAKLGADAALAANGAFPVKWKSKVRGKLAGVVVLRCVEVDERNEKPVLAAVSVDWAQDGENTIIKNVTGLTGGKTYRLTVAALGG